ncbi:GNAT family N-acetyltransferase [Amycolatopsis sp. NPDC051373]|uniref:GNAT family N-acetyltransferase n=1 Tax=Amycolatopsis sp. NPDC051373 TaxID=3155801 RepID=UPI00344CFD34
MPNRADPPTRRPGRGESDRSADRRARGRLHTLAGQAPEGELACLFVEPDHIGTGVGRRLWQHAVDTARTLDFQRLIIGSDPFAEDFYRKMGAVRIGSVLSGSIPGRLLPQLVYRLSPGPDLG